MITTFIFAIIIIVCLLLILAVLVQKPKGSGLASGFSSANQMMGVKRTADLIEKITWGLSIALLFFAIVVNSTLSTGGDTSGQESLLKDKAQEAVITQPQAPAPTQQAQPDQQPDQQPAQ